MNSAATAYKQGMSCRSRPRRYEQRTAFDSWIWAPDLTMARLPRLAISPSTSFGTCRAPTSNPHTWPTLCIVAVIAAADPHWHVRIGISSGVAFNVAQACAARGKEQTTKATRHSFCTKKSPRA